MAKDLRTTALAISDLRDMARRHLPRGIFEYVARGTDEDQALAGNARAFDEVQFVPRVVRNVAGVSPAITLLGLPSAAPIAIAPTGFASLLWLDGEVASARAAAAAGVPFTLSTGSLTPMERIREEAGGRLWLQLYVWPQRDMTVQLMQRAQKAGYETLVITVDTPAAPFRPYNLRNGFSIPFKISQRNIADIACHPRWLMNVVLRNYLKHGRMVAENYPEKLRTPVAKAAVGKFNLPFCDDVTWDEVKELRRRWRGPVLLKGVLSPADAEHAIQAGCDGVIVSNHGGRNLDSAIASLRMLPEIADRIGHKATILLDSGITRGSDIAKALALGANAVLTGKATLFGVGAGGAAGVARALAILIDELTRVMTFVGARDIGALTPDLLRVPYDFARGDDAAPWRASLRHKYVLACNRVTTTVGEMTEQKQDQTDLINGFKALSTPTVSNAFDELGIQGVMLGLNAVARGVRCVGPAVTVSETTGPTGSFPAADFRVGDILDAAAPGSVVVVANNGHPVSTWGGTATYSAVHKGIAGLVVDGAIRDREEIEEAAFPAFSRHLVPITGKSRIRVDAIGVPVICGGIRVRPGDIILADGSGIVCIPLDRAQEVLTVANKIAAVDRQVVKLVDTGLSWKDAMAAASA